MMKTHDTKQQIHAWIDRPAWNLFRELCRVELGMPASHVIERMVMVVVDQSQFKPLLEAMMDQQIQAQKMEVTQEQVQEAVNQGLQEAQEKVGKLLTK